LAVNSRWIAKPFSSRSRAWFTAATNGLISVGTCSCGSRTDMVPGSMAAALADTCRSGRRPRRMASTPIAKVAATISGTSHAMLKTNSRSSDRTRTSSSAARAMVMRSGPTRLSRLSVTPK
jgi:hypothetical protein